MNKNNRRVFIIILFALCAVAIVLAIFVGINLFQQNLQSSSDNINQDETTQLTDEEANVIAKIGEYQVAIDNVKNTDPQAAIGIYQERVFYLMDNQNNQKYADYILADMIAIDDIEQSVNSAIDVMNYAKYLGNEEVSVRYEEIFNMRNEAEGGASGSVGRG